MGPTDTVAPVGDGCILRDFLGDKDERPMLRYHVGVPNLSDWQIRQSVSVVPAYYCMFNCWIFKQEGHSMFTCPYLLPKQRLYFQYRYYFHKMQADPQMAKYL